MGEEARVGLLCCFWYFRDRTTARTGMRALLAFSRTASFAGFMVNFSSRRRPK